MDLCDALVQVPVAELGNGDPDIELAAQAIHGLHELLDDDDDNEEEMDVDGGRMFFSLRSK